MLKHLAPGVFGVAQYGAHKISLLIVGRWRVSGLLVDLWRRLLSELAAQLPENLHRVLTGQQTDAHNNHHGHQA